MADEHVPTREVTGLLPIDPLIAFYWARLDEIERQADGADPATFTAPFRRTLADVSAKKAILDDYAGYCADVDNPARELICRVSRDVIKRLAAVHAGHPDYSEDWRPGAQPTSRRSGTLGTNGKADRG